jgi:hypothetical protein
MAQYRAYPKSAGPGTANSSLAPRVSVPLYAVVSKLSKNLEVPGMHKGATGARPVIYTNQGPSRIINPRSSSSGL